MPGSAREAPLRTFVGGHRRKEVRSGPDHPCMRTRPQTGIADSMLPTEHLTPLGNVKIVNNNDIFGVFCFTSIYAPKKGRPKLPLTVDKALTLGF